MSDFDDAMFNDRDSIKQAPPTEKKLLEDSTYDPISKQISKQLGALSSPMSLPDLESNKLEKISPEELARRIKSTNFMFKTAPRQHQLEAFLMSKDREVFAYFMEMGTGKTKVCIDVAAHLYNTGQINALLVLSNKGSYQNWSKEGGEVEIHMPEHIDYYMTHWDAGANKALSRTYDTLFDPMDKLKIFVANIETMSYDRGTRIIARFAMTHRAMIAIDESTSIKNRAALRTQNCIKLGRLSKYKRLMTGSPVTKSPMDLYAPCEFLNADLLRSSSFYSFQARFADLETRQTRVAHGQKGRSHTYKVVVGYKHLDELQSLLSKFSYRVRKDECLDLPPKIYQTCDVELTTEQKKHYTELHKDLMTVIDNELVSVAIILTKLLRLHQLVCGYLKTDEGNLIPVKSNRLDSLMAIIEECSGKVIIWASYVADIEIIHEALSKEYGSETVEKYYGQTKNRGEIVSRFQDKQDPLKYFVGNPKVGGYSITLTEAQTVIYYSNSYDLEVRLQSEDRAHRMGLEHKVNYVDLVCRGTVDEKILRALREKRNLAAEVLGDPVIFKEWLK